MNNFNIMRENYNSLKTLNRSPLKRNPSPNQIKNVFLSTPSQPRNIIVIQRQLTLTKQNLMQAVEIHGWRSKTSLPILSTAFCEVLSLSSSKEEKLSFPCVTSCTKNVNKSVQDPLMILKIGAFLQEHPEVSTYQLRVKTEDIRWQLSDISQLPMGQTIHLIKEMLIGFEVLIDIFGRFEPNQRMVAVNGNSQWKVWINQDYTINSAQQNQISQKQFIYKLIVLGETHSCVSMQSKQFFNILKEFTYSDECSFVKILEKVNQFMATHRIYHANKVIIPNQKIIHCEGDKNIGKEQDRAGSALNNLKKIVTSYQIKKDMKLNNKPQSNIKSLTSKSVTNLNNPFSKNSQIISKIKKSNICSTPNNKFNQRFNTSFNFAQSPTTSNGYDKPSSFNQMCEIWNSHSMLELSSQITQPNFIPQNAIFSKGNQASYSHNFIPSKTCMRTPNTIKKTLNNTHIVEYKSPKNNKQSPCRMSPVKHRQQIKQIANEHRKPVSQINLQESCKQPNARKYSQQLIKMKSVQNLAKKDKFYGSTIYQNNQLQTPKKKHPQNNRKQDETSLNILSSNSAQLYNDNDSSQIIKEGMSSPHNSSSTKQLQHSGQMQKKKNPQSNYMSMKMKDLGINRYKNNQSVINTCNLDNHGHKQGKQKNMTISYQFHNNLNSQSGSQSSRQKKQQKHQKRWVNKISDLFSDNMSIKQLKESIKFKTQQQKIFQKEYLKDVKLDLLSKFGRNIQLHTQEDDEEHVPKIYKHNQYKSMQLIEQQTEEVKSYREESHDDAVSRSIKSIKSRKHTMQPYQHNKERQISFKDFFCKGEENVHETGFNFQTEMYSMRPHKNI